LLGKASSSRSYVIRRDSGTRLAELGLKAPPLTPQETGRTLDDYRDIVLRTRRPRTVEMRTARGVLRIRLDCPQAPLTCLSFIQLAGQGFFNGLTFHRVVPDFVIQGGDPRGDGEGGPGYTIRDEINQRPYLRGTVGMALDWADTGGSQFFITHAPAPHLNAKYTVFGRVIGGMDVVDQIQEGDVIRTVRVWDGQELSGGK
jgi:cyclophilin family peptidyl-prolyl cis-trans isomerase